MSTHFHSLPSTLLMLQLYSGPHLTTGTASIMLDTCWPNGYRITEYGVREYILGSAAGSQGLKRGGVQVRACTNLYSRSIASPYNPLTPHSQDAILGSHPIGQVLDYSAHGGVGMNRVYTMLKAGDKTTVGQTLSLPLFLRRSKVTSVAALSAQVTMQGHQLASHMACSNASTLATSTANDMKTTQVALNLLQG